MSMSTEHEPEDATPAVLAFLCAVATDLLGEVTYIEYDASNGRCLLWVTTPCANTYADRMLQQRIEMHADTYLGDEFDIDFSTL
jgi:hypothetical protein